MTQHFRKLCSQRQVLSLDTKQKYIPVVIFFIDTQLFSWKETISKFKFPGEKDQRTLTKSIHKTGFHSK